MFGAVAEWLKAADLKSVELFTGSGGSNPSRSVGLVVCGCVVSVAQLVERRFVKARVAGSYPAGDVGGQ